MLYTCRFILFKLFFTQSYKNVIGFFQYKLCITIVIKCYLPFNGINRFNLMDDFQSDIWAFRKEILRFIPIMTKSTGIIYSKAKLIFLIFQLK